MSGTGEYGYVTIHNTTDPAQGEMLAELLRNEGIAARFRGASSTLIGMAKDMATMSVDVPIDDEDRAREFMRALEDTAVAAESGGQTRPAPDVGVQSRRGRRRKLALAATVVAVLALLGLAVGLVNHLLHLRLPR
jgi:hypothetical protein